jgi:hypothetical protein
MAQASLFKKGDIVLCESKPRGGRIVVGQHYTVARTQKNGLLVLLYHEGNSETFAADARRFKLVGTTKKMPVSVGFNSDKKGFILWAVNEKRKKEKHAAIIRPAPDGSWYGTVSLAVSTKPAQAHGSSAHETIRELCTLMDWTVLQERTLAYKEAMGLVKKELVEQDDIQKAVAAMPPGDPHRGELVSIHPEYLVRKNGRWEICHASIFSMRPEDLPVMAWACRDGSFFAQPDQVDDVRALPED